ncbi:uncharacterized protein EDB91DRAFT_1079482 [Suillus paluster]|uniref:uncharacterized protein n=1 Tax=Suillus paluster TaxID=48578 RepID=UPI001B87898C|nr:uncharacterized protein EDB91DRAFT_1079482 [Suillus paluster]KAG1747755.1 hypothetical protein EDB91DRAFT_1079482 [Suillus paluster]
MVLGIPMETIGFTLNVTLALRSMAPSVSHMVLVFPCFPGAAKHKMCAFTHYSLQSPTIMSGCAVAADGHLKDASEIEFFHDVDDNVPIPSSAPAPHASSSRNTLDTFVQLSCSGHAPVSVIAGAHCSGHTSKPSEKVRESIPIVPAKHSGSTIAGHAQKHVECVDTALAVEDINEELTESHDPDDNNDGDGDSDYNGDDHNGKDDEDNNKAFKKTKTFGDADCAICAAIKKVDRTSDIRTVFTQEKGHINPHTKAAEDGWWYELCR